MKRPLREKDRLSRTTNPSTHMIKARYRVKLQVPQLTKAQHRVLLLY